MKIDVITSFDQNYYDTIGQQAVESWIAHWPTEMNITCYLEQCNITPNDRIITIDFDVFDNSYWELQHDTSLKSRVKTFAKKAWCFMHAAATSTADRLIWIDADVITQKTITSDFLGSIMPDSALSTHLGVTYQEDKRGRPGPWLVPETGFFAVNLLHAKFDKFIAEYRRRYLERDYQDLRRFYDNDVYGAAITHCNTEVFDLCCTLKKPYLTPMRHTVLGPYLHHYKARHSKEYFQSACQ